MDEQLLIAIMMLILGASLPVEWGLEKWKQRARKRKAASVRILRHGAVQGRHPQKRQAV